MPLAKGVARHHTSTGEIPTGNGFRQSFVGPHSELIRLCFLAFVGIASAAAGTPAWMSARPCKEQEEWIGSEREAGLKTQRRVNARSSCRRRRDDRPEPRPRAHARRYGCGLGPDRGGLRKRTAWIGLRA